MAQGVEEDPIAMETMIETDENNDDLPMK